MSHQLLIARMINNITITVGTPVDINSFQLPEGVSLCKSYIEFRIDRETLEQQEYERKRLCDHHEHRFKFRPVLKELRGVTQNIRSICDNGHSTEIFGHKCSYYKRYHWCMRNSRRELHCNCHHREYRKKYSLVMQELTVKSLEKISIPVINPVTHWYLYKNILQVEIDADGNKCYSAFRLPSMEYKLEKSWVTIEFSDKVYKVPLQMIESGWVQNLHRTKYNKVMSELEVKTAPLNRSLSNYDNSFMNNLDFPMKVEHIINCLNKHVWCLRSA